MRIDSSSRRALLTYCTNVHPADDVAGLVRALDGTTAAVAQALAPGREFGLGLRLGADQVAELQDEAARARLEELFARRRFRPFTINGFPQGSFHATRVKDAVYRPDWTDPARTRYTLDLARLLARWLPEDDPFGTISTLPVGWRGAVGTRIDEAAHEMQTLARELANIELETGVHLMVCIEPEPGCEVETIAEAAAFFEQHLLTRLSEAVVLRHLGVCWDACHQAVMFEDAEAGLAALARSGIPIGKVQISSALSAACGLREAMAALAGCDEERFLHQVAVRSQAGPGLDRFADLPDFNDAMLRNDLPAQGEARCHFHVPIYAEAFPPLTTTRGELLRTLSAILRGSDVRHFEVETYTFHVLPETLRAAPVESHLVSELEFAREALGRNR
jgi:sugar phosphate isomerase/epimerase